jgi:hypothetical protein
MSTIDKQVRLAQLDRELYSKNADIAYKAFNGTKQSVRNFREGTLDIGKMNFDNTAQDRITKEMITDYHKKEQERFDAQLKGKTETGLSSTIDAALVTPVVQNFGTLGRPATSEDLEKKQEEIVKVVNEINRLDKIIRDAPKRINELEIIKDKSKLKKLTPEWMLLQQPIIDLTREMRTAKTAIPKLEKQLTDLETEMEQIDQNIKDNEQGIINANITNKAVAKRYEDAFNALNQNLYSIKQEPHESEQAYIQRIKQLDTMKYDPQLFKDKAELENSKQLMRNLKEVISDDGKISEIVKSLTPLEIFDINKYWAKIKDTILKIYGSNNKQATVKNYVELMAAVLDTIDTKGSLATVFPSAPTLTPTPIQLPPTPSKPQKPQSGPSVPVVYALSPDNKTLTLTNNDTGKTVYLRIGRGEILYSLVGTENTFIKTRHEGGQHYFKDIMTTLGLIKSNGVKSKEYLELFGIFIAKYHMYENLLKNIGLEETTPLKTNFIHNTTGDPVKIGWGVKNEEVPKFAHFGKNIILLDKLFYKNILSIKDKKMHSVEHFPNVKISDTLTDIIYKMCTKNTKPTKEMLNSLKSNERKLFDLLLYVSGIGKNIGITTAKEEYVKELKDRLKLVESQLRAGNNNPVVKNELKEIIQKLYLYNAISMNNGKAYLKQF